MANIVRRESSKGVASWQVRWRYAGKRDGKGQSVTLTVERDAKRLRGAVEGLRHCIYDDDPRILDRSIITGVTGSREPSGGPTFHEVFLDYLDHQTENRGSSTRTYKSRVQVLEPWLERPAVDLTDDDARALWKYLKERGAPRPPYMLAKAVMNHAMKVRKLRPDNPCNAVKVPRGGVLYYLITDEDMDLMLSLVKEPEDRLLFETIRLTGLRLGEACALQPKDIQIRNGRALIKVRHTITHDEEGWTVGEPKTDNGKREVPIPLEHAQTLLEHAQGCRWVFRGPDGSWLNPGTAQTRWRRVRARAVDKGLSEPAMRIHDMRHTFATELLDRGVPLAKVSRILGHSSIQITADTYGHVDPAGDDLIREIQQGHMPKPKRRSSRQHLKAAA